MTDAEYEKKVKGTKLFCCILAILFSIGLVINFSTGNIVKIIISIIFLILLYLF